MARNCFTMEVLEDGRIKVTQEGGFDGAKHMSADEFLKYLNELAGGEAETKKRPQSLNPQAQQHGHHHHKH